jgi:hypothetical protein
MVLSQSNLLELLSPKQPNMSFLGILEVSELVQELLFLEFGCKLRKPGLDVFCFDFLLISQDRSLLDFS